MNDNRAQGASHSGSAGNIGSVTALQHDPSGGAKPNGMRNGGPPLPAASSTRAMERETMIQKIAEKERLLQDLENQMLEKMQTPNKVTLPQPSAILKDRVFGSGPSGVTAQSVSSKSQSTMRGNDTIGNASSRLKQVFEMREPGLNRGDGCWSAASIRSDRSDVVSESNYKEGGRIFGHTPDVVNQAVLQRKNLRPELYGNQGPLPGTGTPTRPIFNNSNEQQYSSPQQPFYGSNNRPPNFGPQQGQGQGSHIKGGPGHGPPPPGHHNGLSNMQQGGPPQQNNGLSQYGDPNLPIFNNGPPNGQQNTQNGMQVNQNGVHGNSYSDMQNGGQQPNMQNSGLPQNMQPNMQQAFQQPNGQQNNQNGMQYNSGPQFSNGNNMQYNNSMNNGGNNMQPNNGQIHQQNGHMHPNNGQMQPNNGQFTPTSGQMNPNNTQFIPSPVSMPSPQYNMQHMQTNLDGLQQQMNSPVNLSEQQRSSNRVSREYWEMIQEVNGRTHAGTSMPSNPFGGMQHNGNMSSNTLQNGGQMLSHSQPTSPMKAQHVESFMCDPLSGSVNAMLYNPPNVGTPTHMNQPGMNSCVNMGVNTSSSGMVTNPKGLGMNRFIGNRKASYPNSNAIVGNLASNPTRRAMLLQNRLQPIVKGTQFNLPRLNSGSTASKQQQQLNRDIKNWTNDRDSEGPTAKELAEIHDILNSANDDEQMFLYGDVFPEHEDLIDRTLASARTEEHSRLAKQAKDMRSQVAQIANGKNGGASGGENSRSLSKSQSTLTNYEKPEGNHEVMKHVFGQSNSNDNQLVTSMAKRLRKLEETNLVYKKEIDSQRAENKALKEELKLSNKVLSRFENSVEGYEMAAQNQALEKELNDIKKFLGDYGLTWVGDPSSSSTSDDDGEDEGLSSSRSVNSGKKLTPRNGNTNGKKEKATPRTGDSPHKGAKKSRLLRGDPADSSGEGVSDNPVSGHPSSSNSRNPNPKQKIGVTNPRSRTRTLKDVRPSDIGSSKSPPNSKRGGAIDMATIEWKLSDLSDIAEKEARIVQDGNTKIHRFDVEQIVSIVFFEDGLKVGDLPFYKYENACAQRVLRDITDGYFPYCLKDEYPDGVRMKGIDRLKEKYDSNEKIDSRSAKENFLNRLPKQVILANGQIVGVRKEIEEKLKAEVVNPVEKIQKQSFDCRKPVEPEQTPRFSVISSATPNPEVKPPHIGPGSNPNTSVLSNPQIKMTLNLKSANKNNNGSRLNNVSQDNVNHIPQDQSPRKIDQSPRKVDNTPRRKPGEPAAGTTPRRSIPNGGNPSLPTNSQPVAPVTPNLAKPMPSISDITQELKTKTTTRILVKHSTGHYVFVLSPEQTVGELYESVSKHLGLENYLPVLKATFPTRLITGKTETLAEAGLVPNATLFLSY